MFNFHGWIAPHIFPFLKLTQCNKWVFHSFLGNTGSFHYIFLSTPRIRCALYSTVEIIWIDWMLTFRCCSLWCKCCERDSKGHYSQSIHTCLLHAGQQIGWRGWGPLGRPVSVREMTFYPSSLVNMGECRRHTGHLFAVSSRAARRLRRHTKCLFFGLVPPSFHPMYVSHGRRMKLMLHWFTGIESWKLGVSLEAYNGVFFISNSLLKQT